MIRNMHGTIPAGPYRIGVESAVKEARRLLHAVFTATQATGAQPDGASSEP